MRIDVRSDGLTNICYGWRDALAAARSFRRRKIDFSTNAHRCVGGAW